MTSGVVQSAGRRADAAPDGRDAGAFVFKRYFLTDAEIAQAAQLARAMADQKRNVHKEGPYAGLKWFQVDLDLSVPVCAKLIAELGIPTPKLLVFYYLEPGAMIHPHRDLTGAGLNNRIRFHLPIITNPAVDFRVSGRRVRMGPGDLWCLDTSYRHSVYNGGAESRVHIVVECDITPALARKLPRSIATRMHNVWFVGVLAAQFGKAVAKNAVTNPGYFRDQMRMVARFIGWRFLKIGEPR
ncbi:MAG TPA: aspartyl/asparaginyl beta-hydroxylase domain-containing protein [Sphingomonas sp.]|nr:aspartyl/asparaginyl beta-hydroxylase domain-containing protein [Sphingomonas sp.]